MVTTLASNPPMNASAILVPELGAAATCLSCHTKDATLTHGAVAAGAGWRCRRCGQQWDADRLATVAAYDGWVSARGGA
jgi:transposase-like protein